MLPDRKEIVKSVSFRTSRSGGKGGQNVNKVSSKVELIMHIASVEFFSPDEKQLLADKLAHRLDQEGNLHVISQEDRSQLVNKEKTLDKLIALLGTALHVDKLRKPTRTPRSVILKRKSDKKSIALKKESRRRPSLDA
ncbi:aminoacyl-tRNA hydrolase [Pedobacter sp. MC2016-15]|uniref:peptide chain release factor-like protein n=1 Tax=Pedobacter sp. MC2016-15 TaxID=2994473 RepID=UPI002247D40D|nr:peptide chain release factor-like protein [Pedobacter sp. MC2016-15]MCX2479948.1 aminoacyl-tRNA hydrolase [Pedobacter sp. MC2016-15]